MNRVKICGGLGNQFFQYAFAKEIEYKSRKEVQLTRNFYQSEVNQESVIIPTRKFLLDRFNCNYMLVPDGDTSRCSKVVNEKDYDPESKYDDTFFVGYWQSEKYFKDVREGVINELTLRDEYIDDTMKKTVDGMNSTESVSLHVRRTDYLSLDTYPICGKEYYERAVSLIKMQGVRDPVLYVFSDDLKWCYKNLDGLCGCNTAFIDTGVDYKDWHIMSKAKHFIIANSSFSFWAAYASRYSGKIVVAPQKWINSDVAIPTDVAGWKYI